MHYIYETGNVACLEEMIPFIDGGSGPLYEHCRRAFDVALGRRSPRGLPLILKGDWNDGLNAVGAGGKGESIWMAHFLYHLLARWSELPVLEEEVRLRFRIEASALRDVTNA